MTDFAEDSPPANAPGHSLRWPLSQYQSVAMAIVVVLTLVALRAMGRIGWGGDGWPQLWVGDIWSEQCSQQLFDPYVFSHMSHGFFFYALVMWWWPPIWRWVTKRLRWNSLGDSEPNDVAARPWAARLGSSSFAVALMVAIVLECAWEILENSPIIINRYRATTIAVGYTGDSVLNSFMDIVACTAGVFIVRWLGPWRTLALFVTLELATLYTVRDNLTLNVLMLTFPVDSIKEWQEALAPAALKSPPGP